MEMLKHYILPDNKADNSDLIKFGMKIGTVQDLQELPQYTPIGLHWLIQALGHVGQIYYTETLVCKSHYSIN